jgi:sec-independent protein translocase protein TatA
MYSSTFLILNMGGPEMILIFFVVLLLFGGKKLPELARGLGKGLREFKDASEGIKREIHDNINSINEAADMDKGYTKTNTSVPEDPASTFVDETPTPEAPIDTKIAH